VFGSSQARKTPSRPDHADAVDAAVVISHHATVTMGTAAEEVRDPHGRQMVEYRNFYLPAFFIRCERGDAKGSHRQPSIDRHDETAC
jgi:hypothetical protein